jgi:hypothetical protein
MESHLGRDRTVVDQATRRRNDLWKEAFTDFDYNPPKPRTELVTKQGNRVYVVKWTPSSPVRSRLRGLQGISHPGTPRRGRRSFGQGKRRPGAGHCDPPRQAPGRPGGRQPDTTAPTP